MSSVFLTDVDDYISPSQACINPLFTIGNDNDDDSNKKNTSNDASTKENTERGDAITGTNPEGVKRRVVRRRKRATVGTARRNNVNGSNSAVVLETNDSPLLEMSESVPGVALNTNGGTSGSRRTKATVSVADCLACSGCVTSAEAVLVSRHSLPTLRNNCRDEAKTKVVTISPASIADVSRHFSTDDYRETLSKLSTLLHRELGASVVLDAAVTNRISLVETAHEFIHRYRLISSRVGSSDDAPAVVTVDDVLPVPPAPAPSVAMSATTTVQYPFSSSSSSSSSSSAPKQYHHPAGRDDRTLNSTPCLPLLTSSCPGFVCHVEKTAAWAIPYLTSAKSSMAMAGTFLKQLRRRRRHIEGEEEQEEEQKIYHVAIMPCHDKKLEAGRRDLAWERIMNGVAIGDPVPDVDLVITTGELMDLIKEASVANDDVAESNNNTPGIDDAAVTRFWDTILSSTTTPKKAPSSSDNGSENELTVLTAPLPDKNSTVAGSGGYADFIFRYAARELFDFVIPSSTPLPWTPIMTGRLRNVDFNMVRLYRRRHDGGYSLTDGDDIVLQFATAYGFRNIRLTLDKIKKQHQQPQDFFHFVEVMACPAGCLNGGGQLKKTKRSGDDAMTATVRERTTPTEMREKVSLNRAILSSAPDKEQAIYDGDDRGEQERSIEVEFYGGEDSATRGIFTMGSFSENPRRMLHTRFHAVPELELSKGVTAGVAVSDTKW